jgi:hypothetical protein
MSSDFWPEHSDFAVTGQPQLCESLEKFWRMSAASNFKAASGFDFHGDLTFLSHTASDASCRIRLRFLTAFLK